VLKIDGHGYSPAILHRILYIASVTSAFEVAEVALQVVGEISISARHHAQDRPPQAGSGLAAAQEHHRQQSMAEQPIEHGTRGERITGSAAGQGSESRPAGPFAQRRGPHTKI